MIWLAASGLFLAVMSAGLIGLYLGKLRQTIWPKLFLAFGGAYLLGISVLNLLPVIYFPPNEHIGFWLLGGFFLQIILEQFSKGIEHGHLHHGHGSSPAMVWSVMFGLSLHAFTEAIPISYPSVLQVEGFPFNYYLGIVLHEIPAAFALVSFFGIAHMTRSRSLFYLIIFACMAPLGILVGHLIQMPENIQRNLLAVVMGLFLHISTTIIFEAEGSANHHRMSTYKILAILVGLTLVVLTNHH